MKARLLFSFLGISLFLGGCFSREVARVGKYRITKKDVEFRDKLNHIYYPESTEKYGLQQLIKAYTIAEVLKNNDRPITDAEITNEVARIDKETLMPEGLEKVKGIFKGDTDAYRRIFVLPVMAERIVYYEFFLRSEKIQAPYKAKVDEFIQNSRKNPKDFSKLAKAAEKTVAKLQVSLGEGLVWKDAFKDKKDRSGGEVMQAPARVVAKVNEGVKTNEEAKRWIDEFLTGLKPGEVSPRMVDRGEVWFVVRYVGPTKGKKNSHEVEIVAFEKGPYEEWLAAESKKVPTSF